MHKTNLLLSITSNLTNLQKHTHSAK